MTDRHPLAADIADIVARSQAASIAWMQGDAGPFGALISKQGDFSIMGPFGGRAMHGHAPWAAMAPRVAQAFAQGSAEVRLVGAHVSGDLLVLILEEHQRGTIAGRPDHPWSLRVTQVYRREEGEWRVVHRHADPLVKLRDPAATMALADDFD